MTPDDNISRFAQLSADAAKVGVLARLTFSRPKETDALSRVTASLFKGNGGETSVRVDSLLHDGRLIRKNYAADIVGEVF